METRSYGFAGIAIATCGLLSCTQPSAPAEAPIAAEAQALTPNDALIAWSAVQAFEQGRRTFRYDTFGDEEFWGGALRLHQAIAGAGGGGVGPGVSPKAALGLGLKVDVEALPGDLRRALQRGAVDLDAPATTVALLRLNAVVGVTGFFGDGDDAPLRSIGIQCALCHSTVDRSFTAPGVAAGLIGRRLDGWANRDLDVGGIIAASPSVKPFADLLGVSEATVRTVLRSWGPGKFDAELALDGKAFRPDGKSAATLIPPAFGLAGVNLHTWTGWGSVPYWNAFVAVLEMHGKGRFHDSRLADAAKFPVAARAGFSDVQIPPAQDRVTPKLAGLHAYQLALPAPPPPPGSFDRAAAGRGDALFSGKARCVSCHREPQGTEPGWNAHTAAEIGIDDFQSSRSPDGRYRTAPLGGLWSHQKGGFYHDGRFATLAAVVDHYDGVLSLGLGAGEKSDLVEYLKSL